MARVETIIVGGGIAAGIPFVTNGFTYVQNNSPPSIASSPVMSQVLGADPAVLITDSTDPAPADTSILRVKGGFVSEYPGAAGSCVMGIGITLTVAQADAIAIGHNAGKTAAFGQDGVQIGFDAQAGGRGIAIGSSAQAAAAGGTSAHICIGAGAQSTSAGAGNDCVVIGSAKIDGGRVVAIGTGNLTGSIFDATVIQGFAISPGPLLQHLIAIRGTVRAFGGMAFNTSAEVLAGHGGAQVYGVGAVSTGAGHIVFGSDNFTVPHVTTLVLGGDTQDATEDKLIRFANASALANNPGSNARIQAPLSTGNATPGALQIRCGIVGASGGTLQTARTSAEFRTSATAGDTDFLLYDVDNATLERVTVGAADSGGVGFKLLRIPN